VLLCDTASYTVEGVNIQLGTAYDLKLRIVLPLGVFVIPGSVVMSYPPGSPFVSIPDPTFISGTTYEWDLSALNATLGTDGLKGILQNLLNTVAIRFGVRTNCFYTSGSLIAFNFNGRSACGLYTGQEVTLSSQLGITGADVPYETKVDLISTYISPCVNSTAMTVNIVNNGPLATGPSDSVVVVFPPAISYINGSYTGIINAPPNVTFRTYNLNNRQYVQWKLPQGIAAGDSIRFSFEFDADPFSLDCNIQDFEAYTISNKNLLCVLNNLQCGINVRTGDTILPMYVYKANLSFTNITADAVQNGITGERLSIELDILNIGENIVQGNNTIIGFYRDVDGNGVLSLGDILLRRDTITDAINSNATYNYTTTLDVQAGNGCNLIALLDTANNGCICNPVQIFIDSIPLYNAGADQEVCSGSTIQLGGQAVNGYQYTWNPSTGLSNPNVFNPNFSLQNLTGVNDVIVFAVITNRINCTSSDTMQVTVFPQTNISYSGLAATYCSNDAPAPLTGNPLGGTFSGTGISGNDFVPSVAGVGVKNIIYYYTDANNCDWTDTQQTTVFAAPVVTFSGFLGGYCFDAAPVTLVGNPLGGTFSGNGISSNVFTPSVAGAGNHVIVYSYTDANQCTDTDTQTVTVTPLPVAGFTGLNPQYCVNEPAALLTPTPAGGVFSGTGINNGNYFEPRLSGAGNFTIVYSYRDQFQCADTDTQTVTVHPLTPTAFSGLNNQYCIDAALTTLTGSPAGGTFTGNGINGNDFTPAVAGAGSHVIRYTFTDANNCTNADSMQVRIDDLPIVNFTGLAPAYCIDADIAQLNGNQPAGIFIGNGIAGSRFIPSSAGAGQHQIIYSYTDANNCFNADTQQTTVNALPVVSFTGLNPDYCADAPAVVLIPNPTGGTFSGNGVSGNDFNPLLAGAGNHSVKYSYTDANNCFAADSLLVAVHPVPVATAEVNNISCFGADDGNIILTQTDGTPSYQYNWNNGAFNTQSIYSLTESNYDVLITDAAGCTFTASYFISEPDSLITSIETKDAICFDDANGSAIFTATGGIMPYSFNWNNGLTDSVSYSLTANNYSVTITDANGCYYIHDFIINQPFQIWVSATPSFDTLAYGNSIQLNTEYFANDFPVTYLWEPSDGLTCSYCPNPVASPLETTVYTVTLTDSTGCVATDESVIIVKDEKVFYAPNIFSPNNDGINDVFRIYVKGVKKFDLRIFDRWGENVFSTEDSEAGWNGSLNGKELPPGVYVYDVYVIFKDTDVLKKKGSITLVR
jgi:gliding motility-associated-like protein